MAYTYFTRISTTSILPALIAYSRGVSFMLSKKAVFIAYLSIIYSLCPYVSLFVSLQNTQFFMGLCCCNCLVTSVVIIVFPFSYTFTALSSASWSSSIFTTNGWPRRHAYVQGIIGYMNMHNLEKDKGGCRHRAPRAC